MAIIAASEARARFTKMLIDFYRERPIVHSFLRSFFPSVEEVTRYLSIEVQRGTEKVAVDVLRGSDGHRNTFSRSTEKVIEPPLYLEWFDITQLDLYDRLFGSTGIDDGIFTALLQQVAEKLGILQDKIERAYELQCAQVLQTGIVALNSGDNIDFKRKADSLIDLGTGNYWNNPDTDPIENLIAGANFIRQVGKAQGGTLNAILGSDVHSALVNNDKFKSRADVRNFHLDDVRAPQRNSTGAALHGQISTGSYLVNLWTYPEFYDDANSVSQPYIAADTLVLLPENPRFRLGFAAVPQLIDEQNPTVTKGAFVIADYREPRKKAHVYEISSAGIAIPVAVDQIWTVKAVGPSGS